MTTTDVATSTPTVLTRIHERIVAITNLGTFLADHPDLVAVVWLDSSGGARYHSDDADEFATLVRSLKDRAPLGSITKDHGDYVLVERDFGAGVKLILQCLRETVCEAVVVGKETVEVPDPDAPRVTVERDVIEWRCTPLLDDEARQVDDYVESVREAENDHATASGF